MSRLFDVLAAAGCAVLVLAAPIGTALEAGMPEHMLIQMPLLAALGWHGSRRLGLARWRGLCGGNAYGVNGLLLVALVSSYWMLPAALDLAVIDPRMDALKGLCLILAGAALELSWQPAGAVVQAFFLGNWCAMEVLAGLLYRESGRQLCSAYPVDDQAQAGIGMIAAATLIGLGWGALQIRRSLVLEEREDVRVRRAESAFEPGKH